MAKQFEADIIDVAQDFVKQGKAGIRLLPGVERLLGEIRSHHDSESSYAICTSGQSSHRLRVYLKLILMLQPRVYSLLLPYPRQASSLQRIS